MSCASKDRDGSGRAVRKQQRRSQRRWQSRPRGVHLPLCLEINR